MTAISWASGAIGPLASRGRLISTSACAASGDPQASVTSTSRAPLVRGAHEAGGVGE
ncbi:hypothetical protein ACFQ0B_48555 [Nonomuraea thailandensis]